MLSPSQSITLKAIIHEALRKLQFLQEAVSVSENSLARRRARFIDHIGDDMSDIMEKQTCLLQLFETRLQNPQVESVDIKEEVRETNRRLRGSLEKRPDPDENFLKSEKTRGFLSELLERLETEIEQRQSISGFFREMQEWEQREADKVHARDTLRLLQDEHISLRDRLKQRKTDYATRKAEVDSDLKRLEKQDRECRDQCRNLKDYIERRDVARAQVRDSAESYREQELRKVNEEKERMHREFITREELIKKNVEESMKEMAARNDMRSHTVCALREEITVMEREVESLTVKIEEERKLHKVSSPGVVNPHMEKCKESETSKEKALEAVTVALRGFIDSARNVI